MKESLKKKKVSSQTESAVAPTLDHQTLHQKIAERAYELFLTRGHVHGYDMQDWLKAEQAVLSEIGFKKGKPSRQLSSNSKLR